MEVGRFLSESTLLQSRANSPQVFTSYVTTFIAIGFFYVTTSLLAFVISNHLLDRRQCMQSLIVSPTARGLMYSEQEDLMYTSKRIMPLHQQMRYQLSIPPPVGSWFAKSCALSRGGIIQPYSVKRSYLCYQMFTYCPLSFQL